MAMGAEPSGNAAPDGHCFLSRLRSANSDGDYAYICELVSPVLEVDSTGAVRRL